MRSISQTPCPQLRSGLASLVGGLVEFEGLADGGQGLLALIEVDDAADPDLANARRIAQESLSDPEHFLTYRRVFGDDLPVNDRFRAAFVDALTRLRSAGVRPTLAAAMHDS